MRAGRRVEKISGSTKTDYLYDPSGNVFNELNNVCAPICVAVDYLYLGGQLIGEYKASTTYFFHQDHLGSTRRVARTQTPNEFGCPIRRICVWGF